MVEHENTISQEAVRIKEEFRQFFVHSSIDCPYGLPYLAVYNQALFDNVPDFIMDAYLSSGYRRNGNIIYNMHCNECQACVPIRIDPNEFTANRSQKRVWNKNLDVTVEIAPLACTDENLILLEKFLAARYPGRESSAQDYYSGFFLNHITSTVEFRFRVESKLIGVAVADLGSTWLNVVFFYFDPREEKRSPGTFNILYLIDFCRLKETKFIYLGYWIENVKSMSYKSKFKPHYIFRDNIWELVSR